MNITDTTSIAVLLLSGATVVVLISIASMISGGRKRDHRIRFRSTN